MKAQVSNAARPDLNLGTPGATTEIYLEIKSQGHGNSRRWPVSVKDLSPEGVILEAVDLPPECQGESWLNQEGVIHLVPDGMAKETRLPSKVVWIRQGEQGASHYLLGLELGEADLRAWRSLEKLRARPNDIAELWTYWDRVHTKPAASDGRVMFYVGAGALVAGVALHLTLPETFSALATIVTFFGIYLIAGKCLWNWWSKRRVPKEC